MFFFVCFYKLLPGCFLRWCKTVPLMVAEIAPQKMFLHFIKFQLFKRT